MKIGILTSSRADFGIYYPLVKELWNDGAYDVEIIAFGTHLKEKYGHTIDEIINFGFEVKHRIVTDTDNNSPYDVAKTIGNTILKFSKFWKDNSFDLVLALGDRYEMFGAVAASSPYNIDIAHIHAGETTLGAIDNAYRHSISLMSKYLFVSTGQYKQRAVEIIKRSNDVFNIGALSIDNLTNQRLLTTEEFKEKYDIDMSIPMILSTFHPETVSLEKNETYINELIASFKELENKYQIVITMPNSDTMGDMIRNKLNDTFKESENVKLVESLGMQGYLSCIKFCKMMIGNTSSGFVEGAFFPKWVINLGDRQKGRIITDNIINSKIKKQDILKSVKFVEETKLPVNLNIYGEGNTAPKIVHIIKNIYRCK